MAEKIEQNMIIGVEYDGKKATEQIEQTAKSIDDLSEAALRSAKHLSGIFTKEQIKQAENYAKVFRNFGNIDLNVEQGLIDTFRVDQARELGEAFAQMTASQSSAITNFIEEPKEVLQDFSKQAQMVAKNLSNLFDKEQIRRAKDLATTIRLFNEGWKKDTETGLSMARDVQTVEQLAEAFSHLSASETSAIEKLSVDYEGKLSNFEKRMKAFTDNAKKSLTTFRKSLDRIASIIRYRIIRGGLSLITAQLNEGVKAVYMFVRAYRSIDQNHIADKLDKYATLLDNIRGNLGAVWATLLANMSTILEPLLIKVSDFIEKMTALTSAIGGSATYWGVAADNAKRYYSTVANGMQDLNVIGSNTRMENKLIPDDIKDFGEKLRGRLGAYAELGGDAMTGLGILLMATGHIVAGLGLAAAGLGISNIANQLDEMDTDKPKSAVETVLTKIQALRKTFSLGIGLACLATGNFAFGIPLIVDGLMSSLSAAASNDDLEESVRIKLIALTELVSLFEVGLGVALLCTGNIPIGLALIASGLTTAVTTAVQNWDFIKQELNKLMEIISNWWEEVFTNGIKKKWDDFWADPLGSISNAFDKLAEWWGEIWGNIKQGWKDFWADPFGGIYSILPDWLKKILDKFFPGDSTTSTISHGGGGRAFATGGFPSAGSIFLAGEVPGQTELLGTINGRTGVAGGAEITGIREAIYEVGAEILASMQNSNVNVTLEGDADKLFNVVRNKAADYNRRTGEYAF